MIGYVKKAYGSLTGWEKSHFGGYQRMITDHPYIALDWNIQIVAGKDLQNDLSIFTAEKLIKLYLLKMKQKAIPYDRLHTSIKEETCMFTGKTRKYQLIHLDNAGIFNELVSYVGEYAPLFEFYKKGLLESYLRKELPPEEDEEQQQSPDGDGEDGDQDDSDNSEGDSSGDGDTPPPPAKVYESMLQALDNINEFKGNSFTKSLGTTKIKEPEFMQMIPGRTDYKFSSSEIRDAENLVKLLDISFDPKSDVVNSLRSGKLDVRKIAEVPAGSTSIYKQIVEDQNTKPFTVCILADMSGSMMGIRKDIQFNVLNSLYLAMSSILPEDKLFIYGHTGDESPEIYTFYSPYDANYAKNIRMYNSIEWCQNYDGPVIEAVHKKVRSITDDRIIFISLSDGEPAGVCYGGDKDKEDMKRILERARRDDFVTVGIGMQYMADKNLYNYYATVNDLSCLAKDVSHVINSVVRAEFK
jgi:hypothetical protein